MVAYIQHSTLVCGTHFKKSYACVKFTCRSPPLSNNAICTRIDVSNCSLSDACPTDIGIVKIISLTFSCSLRHGDQLSDCVLSHDIKNSVTTRICGDVGMTQRSIFGVV